MAEFYFDVFLSYANEDKNLARRFVDWLRESGHDVWIDEEQLIPGTRFRSGLQQGLRESRHMACLLTKSYISRRWTQREVDLFDLDADQTRRRIFGIELFSLTGEKIDQVFQIHQRIKWESSDFDPEAFWKLICGLKGERPGPRSKWHENGIAVRNICKIDESKPQFDNLPPTLKSWEAVDWLKDSLNPPIGSLDIVQLSRSIIHSNDYKKNFSILRKYLKSEFKGSKVDEILFKNWAAGLPEVSSILVLASSHDVLYENAAWPFVDLDCPHIFAGIMQEQMENRNFVSEIWFSWAISQQHWADLHNAAERAPPQMQKQFMFFADHASKVDNDFFRAEAEYDYGVMITPWNHFHLSWLAIRLGERAVAREHIMRLIASGKRGDTRTKRFLTRLSAWSVFSSICKEAEIQRELNEVLKEYDMLGLEYIPPAQSRLQEIWEFSRI